MNLPAKLMFYSMLILTLVSLTNRYMDIPLYSVQEKPLHEELVVTRNGGDVRAFRITIYRCGGLNVKTRLKLRLEHETHVSALDHLGDKVVLSVYSSNVTPVVVTPSFTTKEVFETNVRVLDNYSKLLYQGSLNINFALNIDNVFAEYVIVIVGYELLDPSVSLSKYIPPILVKTVGHVDYLENISLHKLVERSTRDLNVAVITKNYLINFLNNHVTYRLTTHRSIARGTLGDKGLVLGWILTVALITLDPYPFIRIPYTLRILIDMLRTAKHMLSTRKRGLNSVSRR